MGDPRVSIITSLYRGDNHIEGFLENITAQTYFDKCELFIVDSASSGNEDETIQQYQDKYDNIKHHRLEDDPGIYGCWNYAIERSSGEYLTNANLDDSRAHNQIERFVQELDKYQEIDLVYGYTFVTEKDHEDFYHNSSGYSTYPTFSFSREAMIKCLPGCQPVWRRSIHQKVGFFDEEYRFAGDWEMWLRAVRSGCRFRMVEGVYGLYYHNPSGLSTDSGKQVQRFAEEKKVFWEYTDVFGPNTTNMYREYFSRSL